VGIIKENNSFGRVKALCVSKDKGTKKQSIEEAFFKENFGIVGDAHAGSKRQVSLLAEESIEKMRVAGLDVAFGDFAENIVSEGIDLKNLALGTKIKLGESVILEITQIGKACLSKCAIYYRMGDCIMPKDGVFAKVLKGGIAKVEDKIELWGHNT